MKHTLTALSTLALFAAPAAQAASSLLIDLTADGDSRVYDYFSDVYAQIDQEPDGFYLISTDGPIGGGLDVFPSEGSWSNIGSFELSGMATGIGTESFSITAAAFDFGTYISSDFTAIGPYLTSITINSGSVSLLDGVVTALTLDSDIDFIFPAVGGASYSGGFDIDLAATDQFTLDVDDTNTFPNPFGGFADLRYEWNATGAVNSTLVIPEPSTALLGALGFACALRRRRK
ncbi:MAG: PEP-CTERM sorting domain-containing protein [Verrucomicrobiota bacterium]